MHCNSEINNLRFVVIAFYVVALHAEKGVIMQMTSTIIPIVAKHELNYE
jgi:hypothetical protein